MAKKIPLKTLKIMHNVINEAVSFHKAIESGLSDALIWDNLVPTRDGGARCLTNLLEREKYSPKKRSEVKQLLEYWNGNYDALRTQVFYRANPEIHRSEIKR